jgi:Zn-finger protein
MHKSQAERNFNDKHEKVKNLVTAEYYNCHMGYVDNGQNGYWPLNWMENMEADKKIIFYNNSYITKYCS